MYNDSLWKLADRLAFNRKSGAVSDLPLNVLLTEEDAWLVQSIAASAFANDAIGYAIAGGDAAIRSHLGIWAPIYSVIPIGTCVPEDHHPIRLPEGFIGAQCDLVFTIGGPIGVDREPVTRETFSRAVLSCQPAIGLLGRRGHPTDQPQLAAIADFAFHVATIVGRHHETIELSAFERMSVRASIDGDEMLHVRAGGPLIDPVASAVWLANELIKRGCQLGAGDIIAAGALAPTLLQVVPGQTLKVEIPEIGGVTARFA